MTVTLCPPRPDAAPAETGSPFPTAASSAKDRTFAFWSTSEHYRAYGSAELAETPHRRRIKAVLGTRRRVLDLACGDGNNLPHLVTGVDYIGLDCSPVALARLHDRTDHPRLEKRGLVGDCENLPLADGSIDVVLSTFAFEHFTNVSRILAEVDRVLVPGGRLILIGPDFQFPNNFGPPQHDRLLGRRGPLLAYAAGRFVRHWASRLIGRQRFAYCEPLPLDDATYIPDADMTHLTDHAGIARHLAARGYQRLIHETSTPKPTGLRGWLAAAGLWGQNGDVLLAMQKAS